MFNSDGFFFFGFLVLFIGAMVFGTIYSATLQQECRLNAIQKGYAAVDIQAICK